MKKILKSKNGFIHLYNPQKEGLGCYDIHYINAYRKSLKIKTDENKLINKRNAA